nr:origin recognition complex subunit 2 [Hymenolepis microstoma]
MSVNKLGRSKSLRSNPKTVGTKEDSTVKKDTLLSKTVDKSPTGSEAIDDYFMRRNTKTSKRSLAELRADAENGLPDPQHYAELLAMYRHPSIDFLESNLMVLTDNLLPNVCAHLESGFNVILYGVGSKIRILQKFQTDYLKGYDSLSIAGYSSSMSIRKILNTIVEEVLGLEKIPLNATTRLNTITEFYSRDSAAETPLYLLINCIDGPNLRSAITQSVLGRLALVPHIRLLATMDNPNLPILWSQTEVSQFNWVWEECTTLLPYKEEACFANSRLLQRVLRDCNESGKSGDPISGLRHIWASITQNARDIFRLLAEYQLEEIKGIEAAAAASSSKLQKNKAKEKAKRGRDEEDAATCGPKGMPLEELYWRCRDAFLATSEVALRAQLIEFKDHKFIKFTKDANGTEMVSIPLPQVNLVQILENKEVFS